MIMGIVPFFENPKVGKVLISKVPAPRPMLLLKKDLREIFVVMLISPMINDFIDLN
jgi:hypothetical protein